MKNKNKNSILVCIHFLPVIVSLDRYEAELNPAYMSLYFENENDEEKCLYAFRNKLVYSYRNIHNLASVVYWEKREYNIIDIDMSKVIYIQRYWKVVWVENEKEE